MIEHFLQPDNPGEALDLMKQHADSATWFAGGSKLNAKPTLTTKTVAISLGKLKLDTIELNGEALQIGATSSIQSLIDSDLTPAALKSAAAFIYSKNIRNQATIAGEIAAAQEESLLIPTLIALKAQVVTADQGEISVEDYVKAASSALILQVVIPNVNLVCANQNMTRSAAGLSIVNAAVSVAADGSKVIAIDGVNSTNAAVRLSSIESQDLADEALEQAVSQAVSPVADIRGSVEYKKYISGVVVADLLAECQCLIKEA